MSLFPHTIFNTGLSLTFFLRHLSGMSITTVTAARIYKGQKVGKPGEEEELSFDKFPFAAFSRVRNMVLVQEF